MRNNKKMSNGITLIALVVTIIVLLILAGISIQMLTGNNGILTKAGEAKVLTESASELEGVELSVYDAMLSARPINGFNNFTTEDLKNGIKRQFGAGAEDNLIGTGPWTYNGEYDSYIIDNEGNIKRMDLQQVIDENPGEFAGEGTKEEPYLIESIEDLVALSTNTNKGETYSGKSFKLTTNLDFNSDKSYVNANTKYNYDVANNTMEEESSGESIKKLLTTGSGFMPIGVNSSNRFEGIFDGNKSTINNLYINIQSSIDYGSMEAAGLFGYIDGDSEIENLTLTGRIINENTKVYNIGSIVGFVNDNGNAVIKKCNNYVNITINQNKYLYVGGIVGLSYGDVQNCINYGNINSIGGGSIYGGGIVGFLGQREITNCSNNGIINCESTKMDANSYETTNVGGITGYLDGGTINNCINNKNLTGKSISMILHMGGIAGYGDSWTGNTQATASITNCTNIGNAICNSESGNINIGGILGFSKTGTIVSSNNNSGTITATTNGTVNQDNIIGYTE